METNLSDTLTIVSKAATDTLKKFAREHDLAENWHVVVSFRLSTEIDLFHIQRLGTNPSIIYINATYYLALLEDKEFSKESRENRSRFKMFSLRAIKLANTMSKSGHALITSDMAYALTSTRKKIRRAIIETQSNALDDRYFSISGKLVVTEHLTGMTLTADIVPVIPLENQVQSLKHKMSLVMLQHAETEEVIDLLEMARKKNEREYTPELYKLGMQNGGIVTTVSYNANMIPIPQEEL